MQGNEKQSLYPIGVVEQLTELTARQIRYYEAKSLLQPRRTPGRQRLYSLKDVERLREIKSLMARGMTLEDVREVLERRAARTADRADAGTEPLAGQSSPRLTRHMQLTSLYPVRNGDMLVRLIDERGGTPPRRKD